MNTLGFLIEQNNDGYNYFYTVDGIKLKYKDFRPARYRTILDTDETDWDFEDNSMVILNECGCGFWECDCVVARVIQETDKVKWQIHFFRSTEIISEFSFEKRQYDEVMTELYEAVKEKLRLLKRIKKGKPVPVIV